MGSTLRPGVWNPIFERCNIEFEIYDLRFKIENSGEITICKYAPKVF